jgi:hypothetical protein
MASRHLASNDEDERGRAVQRLRAAVAERGRARDVREASSGNADDVDERASLRAADDHGGSPASPTRLHELERACEFAEQRLRRTRSSVRSAGLP